jgi:four helix bundle protein
MATVKSNRELIAWQKAMDLACEVYHLTRTFPRAETYGLTRQVREAAVSIASNIAEGQARGTREFRHYLSIALGSLQELESQLLLAGRLRFLESGSLDLVLQSASEVGRLIRGLGASLRSEDGRDRPDMRSDVAADD